MDILRALRGHRHTTGLKATQLVMLMAGATGNLGNAVWQRLAGSTRHPLVRVLARENMKPALASVEIAVRGGETIVDWPLRPVGAGVALQPDASAVAGARVVARTVAKIAQNLPHATPQSHDASHPGRNARRNRDSVLRGLAGRRSGKADGLLGR